jgi:hypothetical protein
MYVYVRDDRNRSVPSRKQLSGVLSCERVEGELREPLSPLFPLWPTFHFHILRGERRKEKVHIPAQAAQF